MKFLNTILLLVILIASNQSTLNSCTNFLITKGASVDGATMITYAADAGGFMEPLFFHAGGDHKDGEMLKVYDWDTGTLLGEINQAKKTYRVIGNMNEFGLVIGETTYTGIETLRDTTGIIDYGSLIRITLQRAKTAREAIKTIEELTAKYGYYSTGESFSIADPNEVWIMELIGKGVGKKGINYAARKIPDGYISAHANQARIQDIDMNDKENWMWSKDVIEFAKKEKIYVERDGKFSFADTYNPLDPGGALFCEGRVWRFYSLASPSANLSTDRFRAVKDAEPYPLFIKPDKKLAVSDLKNWMRDHFEGTDFDMTQGLAAGPYACPYRWKNLTWKLDGDTTKSYGWERPIGTQQTAWSYISQSRADMPREIGNVLWYGVDAASTSCYVPFYAGNTSIPYSYDHGSIAEFSWDVAFWVFNSVANRSYLQYSLIIKDINAAQDNFETKFLTMQPSIEKAALEMYKTNPELAVEYLTDYSNNQAEKVVSSWRELWKFITVKYNDGYMNDVNVSNGRSPKGVGYDQDFLKEVIKSKPGYYDVEWRNK